MEDDSFAGQGQEALIVVLCPLSFVRFADSIGRLLIPQSAGIHRRVVRPRWALPGRRVRFSPKRHSSAWPAVFALGALRIGMA
jgi:hypothetical protein